MARTKKHKPIRRKYRARFYSPRQSINARKKLRRAITSVWSIIVGLSVLMTIIATVYAFSTKVSVTPEVTSDVSDPFRSPFILSNDSYLPITDVTFSCNANNIQPDEFVDDFPKGTDGQTPHLGSWTLKPGEGYKADYLAAGEKRTFECLSIAGLLKRKITSATIEINVGYRPVWILWKQERSFRFDTQRNKDGILIWLPQRHY
jgi:hypothetical protein